MNATASTPASSTKGFFLAFLGGALLGAAAAFAADAENRKMMMSYLDKTRGIANRVPAALQEAKGIALEAISKNKGNAKNAIQDVGEVARDVFDGVGLGGNSHGNS